MTQVAKYQFLHAKRRCKERLHVKFNRTDHRHLVEQIHLGPWVKKEEPNNLKIICTLMYKGKLCKVVYDRRTSRIVTFLHVNRI